MDATSGSGASGEWGETVGSGEWHGVESGEKQWGVGTIG